MNNIKDWTSHNNVSLIRITGDGQIWRSLNAQASDAGPTFYLSWDDDDD